MAARRAGVTLNESQYQQAETFVRAGQTPEQAVQAVSGAPAASPPPSINPRLMQLFQKIIDRGHSLGPMIRVP